MMPEEERDCGWDAEEDGPQWNEGRDLMGEADFQDLITEELDDDED